MVSLSPELFNSALSSLVTEMAPYLESITAQLSLGDTSALLDRLKAKNKEELERLDGKIEDARQNLGETDISDSLKARASYLARIGHKVPSCVFIRPQMLIPAQELALEAYAAALEKVVGIGSRIDLRLAMIRVAFFHGDLSIIADNVEKAKSCVLCSAAGSGNDTTQARREWRRLGQEESTEGL